VDCTPSRGGGTLLGRCRRRPALPFPGEAASLIPINPTTGKRYRGINAIQLLNQGRVDQRWLTYNQAAAVGAQVRKGEHGTPIQYWKFSEEQTRTDESGRPVLDAQGKPVKAEVRLERPRVFFATVFNAEQIDGLPPMQRREQTWDAVERAEAILQASGAVIQHGGQTAPSTACGPTAFTFPTRASFPAPTTITRSHCTNSGTGLATHHAWAATWRILSAARATARRNYEPKSPA
jgi:putative DNA primase/helicase